MHAEILAIGDEITSGQTLDTNSQWLSQRLEELGVRTLFHSTVGDELEPCVEVVQRAMTRADVVVATGGLGPTADDLTRQALAQATGRPLQLDGEALEHIRAMFARRSRPMPPQNELQAMFPAGSRVVRNPHGTAPGIDLEVPREGRGPCRVICLPGVPAEMIEMWRGSVAAAITGFLGADRRVIRRRKINCFGAGESQIELMLPDMIRRGRQPAVGITASKATISLRIAAEGATEAECYAAMEPTVATIRHCLGTLIFGEEDEELQHAVVRLLRDREQTLATGECGTGGLMAEWLARVERSADTFRGGLVLPDDLRGAKTPLHCNGGGLVIDSAGSAEAMALHCREQFSADWGLAVVLPSPAGRGAGGEGGGAQTATVALASPESGQQRTIPCGIHPALLRIYVAKQALNFVRLALLT